MTGRTIAVSCLLVLLAGCGDGDEDARREEALRDAAAKEADAAYGALVAYRRSVVEELQGGAVDPARRAALEAEEKRLSEQIRNANNERLRRDREEVRRQISEQRRGGK